MSLHFRLEEARQEASQRTSYDTYSGITRRNFYEDTGPLDINIQRRMHAQDCYDRLVQLPGHSTFIDIDNPIAGLSSVIEW